MPEDAELKEFLLENISFDEQFLQYRSCTLTYGDMYEYVFNGAVTNSLKLFAAEFIGKGTKDSIPDDHLMFRDTFADGTELKIYSVDLLTILEETLDGI